MGRIKDLTTVTEVATDDRFVIDGATNGTRAIDIQSVLPYIYNAEITESSGAITEGFNSLPSTYTTSWSDSGTGTFAFALICPTASLITSRFALCALYAVTLGSKVFAVPEVVAIQTSGSNTQHVVSMKVYDNDGTLADPLAVRITLFLW